MHPSRPPSTQALPTFHLPHVLVSPAPPLTDPEARPHPRPCSVGLSWAPLPSGQGLSEGHHWRGGADRGWVRAWGSPTTARAPRARWTPGRVAPAQHLCKAAKACTPLPSPRSSRPCCAPGPQPLYPATPQSWPGLGSHLDLRRPCSPAQADPQELRAGPCPVLLASHSSLPALFICTARRQKAIALSHSCSPVGSDSCRRPTAGTSLAINCLVSLRLYSEGLADRELECHPLHP